MKKIIIVNNNLETGGVQTSLINLIDEIHNRYDVTLLLFYNKLEYSKKIPNDVRIISVNSPFKHFGMSKSDVCNKPILYIERAFWALITKFFGRSFAIKMMLPFQKKYKGYDYAFSYLHEGGNKSFYGGCNEFVLNRIEAKQKAGWLHCDFSMCGANNSQSRKIYNKFDKIIACSEGTCRVFCECIPELAHKCVVIRNCNNYSLIKSLAQPGIIYDKRFFNIITVARLSAEKGIERVLHSVKMLRDKGFSVKYHIVGYGIEEARLKKLVCELNLHDNVCFYGNQINPYPYMINADLFVLASYHEAAPMVFDEAACLGLPVLATETISASEMVIQTRSGFVCENSQSALDNALLFIVDKMDELDRIRLLLSKRCFNNLNSIRILDDIIDCNI